MSVLCVEGLSHTYRGGGPVLRSVGFSIEKGQLVALVGPNGAGKSTLLRIAAGLVAATAGRVALFGRPVSAFPPAERAAHLAYVPQFEGQDVLLSVEEMVSLGRLSHQGPGARLLLRPFGRGDWEMIEKALFETDLWPLRRRPYRTLSGGERQRVHLAMAFAQGARLLLLDEPGAHLDPGRAQDMMERLYRKSRQGASVLVALHDLNLASLYADRLLLLHEGVLAASGRPGEVLEEGRLRRVFGPFLSCLESPVEGRPVVVVRRGSFASD